MSDKENITKKDSNSEEIPEKLPGESPKAPVFHSQDVSSNPGVYIFRNRAGTVIYVGKAKNLRRRMRSYFMSSTFKRSDPRRRALINSIASYQTFEVDTESEALLLEAQFIKQYHPRYNVYWRDDKRYLHVRVDINQKFPRLSFSRLKKDDGCLYFGPFPQSTALRETVRLVEKRFFLRSCKVQEPVPETQKHCLEHIIRDCSSPCVGKISVEDYNKQLDKALAVFRGEPEAAKIAVELHKEMQAASAELNFEEAARLRDMLQNFKTILEPARRFVNQTISRRLSLDNNAAVQDLQKLLGLEKAPAYIECFDMSNIAGRMAVGSMVCFRDGRPSTAEYRRFRIRSTEAHDDISFMKEVLTRRYTRVLQEKLAFPDLIVLDGGIAQLNIGIKVFEELDLPALPLLALAEKQELVYLPGYKEAVALPVKSQGLKLLQAVRDEAHRFANTYHRELRNKKISNSILAEIPGIGKVRQTKLLQTFGSVKNISEKTAQELAEALPGLGLATAEKILEFLHKRMS